MQDTLGAGAGLTVTSGDEIHRSEAQGRHQQHHLDEHHGPIVRAGQTLPGTDVCPGQQRTGRHQA
jgi:hypothetical protein